MIIEFLGAAQTVTGSMHLLHINGNRILLECGLFQGKRAESEMRNRNFLFEPQAINAVILSHAHIDHCGNIPRLIKQGFSGPIYCTPATYDLCQIMLADSGHIQEKDAEYVTKKHRKKNLPPVEPLYTSLDAKTSMKYFRRISYHSEFSPIPGVIASFVDAGHMLGSASIKLQIKENGFTVKLGFTGDLGRPHMPILRDPQALGDINVLISESTYGGKLSDPPEALELQLSAIINLTVNRGGKIIIPAFSVGRTQDLIYTLHLLREKNAIPDIPIFIDSPMAINATDIFRRHPECFDDDVNEFLLTHEDPFGMRRLNYVRSVDDSKRLNEIKSPCIIISSSGMCEAGRIRHHLANNIEDERNTILIVGYQAMHTLGRRLADQMEEVTIFGEVYKRNAEVAVLNSMSAHADGDELFRYISQYDNKTLEYIFLVHGELSRAQILRHQLLQENFMNVEIPECGSRIEI